LILLSCNSQKAKESYENFPMEVTNEYKKAKSWIRFDKPEFGTLYTYYLKKPKIIQEIPCKGKFILDKDSNLYAFTLSKDHSFYGNNIPKGSGFEARVDKNNQRSGFMIYLSKDFKIDDIFFEEGNSIEIDKDGNTHLI
jgi:hypothetical protein